MAAVPYGFPMVSASTPSTCKAPLPADSISALTATSPAAEQKSTWKTIAAAVPPVLIGTVFVGYALWGGGDATRCTTEYGTPPAATPSATPAATPTGGATPTPSAPPPSSPTAATAVTPPPAQGPAGLAASKRTCTPIGLADPPLAVLGIAFLLLAVPTLRITQFSFAGMTLTRAIAGATDAAKSASQAADRAATAALTVANAATARSSAAATAQGNIVNLYGGHPRDFAVTETGVAFTLAANGVAEAVQRTDERVSAAVVLWWDPTTDSLRPHSKPSSNGVDLRSPLGDFARRGLAVPFTIIDASDVQTLGLKETTQLPAEAAVIPAKQPNRRSVGLILVVFSTTRLQPDDLTELRTTAIKKIEPYGPPAAVLIERLTTAGQQAVPSD